MKTVKMPVLDRNAKTITVTREFLIRAGQFGSTEFTILLDMQKTNPGFMVAEQKCTRNSDKVVHAALTYDKMVDFMKGYHKDENELKAALSEYIIIKKTSKTMPAAYAYVKKWFLGKYKKAFKDYEDEQKAKAAAANATVDKDELNTLLKTAN